MCVLTATKEILLTVWRIVTALRDLMLCFLPKRIVKRLMGEGTFSFTVHPRDLRDFYILFPAAKYLPSRIQRLWTRYWGPVVLGRIEGLKQDDTRVSGWLLGTTVLAEDMFPQGVPRKQLLKATRRSERKIRAVCQLASKLGVQINGLGALTPAITRYGVTLSHQFEGMGITTGHAYTSLIIARYVCLALQKMDLDYKDSVVAIIGAGGSTGKLVSLILTENPRKFKKFILVDLPEKLEGLRKFAYAKGGKTGNITVSSDLYSLREADIVVTVTNSPQTILKREFLKPGVVVIDDAQPSNAGPELMREGQILVIQVLCSDPTLRIDFRWNIPQGTIFTCLGETFILALHDWHGDFAVGLLEDTDLVDRIRQMEWNTGVRHADFTSFGHRVTDEMWSTLRAVRRKLGFQVAL